MITAVLFDFDGTLINTNDLIFQSHNFAFKTVLNRCILQEEFLNLYGRPLKEALKENYGDISEELLKQYLIFNDKEHDNLVKSFPKVKEGLKLLKNNNIKIGIVTSKRMSTLQKGIDFLNFNGMFDCLVTPADSEKHKPDPDPIIIGCKKIGSLPENTVYVGDSVFDIQAAGAAGTKKCVVNYTLTPKVDFFKYNPDFYCDTIYDFAKELLEYNQMLF